VVWRRDALTLRPEWLCPSEGKMSMPKQVRNSLASLAYLGLLMLNGCTVEKIDVGAPIATENSDGTDDRDASVDQGEKVKIAYVTNGIAAFWSVAEAGCQAAADDFNCDLLVRMPPNGADDQKRMLEELINMKVDGVAVSPINSENQMDVLKQVAASTNMITHDSDAPDSNRLAYIGMDNYVAGRMCGKVVKEAIPDGGDVMIFVGRLGQLNADLRRQGVIDELLDRSNDATRRDPTGEVLEGAKYRVLDTRTDNFDFANAKAQAEDAIVKYPNLACMVGLFSYNPPSILEAVAGAGKLGDIKVVAFDEEAPTLQAIKDGTCYGTVVQDPYMYGYKSVELLAKLARGDRSLLPQNEDKFIDIPARVITRDNVDEFWAKLKELTGKAAPAG
jgi:ribose transport system substrate-binding protein